MLREDQNKRYSRNIQLSELGVDGQEKLLASKILIIGAGGLGSPVSTYLGVAGVGTIGIIDDDVVDISNLQRQFLYTEDCLGKSKAQETAKRIIANNSDITVNVFQDRFDSINGPKILKDYDFVIDATDSIVTKFLINDLCISEKIPFCHGGVLEFVGQVMTVIPQQTACYRCFFNRPPKGDAARKCSHAGILGSVAGTIGTIQATEALKYITGVGELLTNSLLIYEAIDTTFRTVSVRKNPECKACAPLS